MQCNLWRTSDQVIKSATRQMWARSVIKFQFKTNFSTNKEQKKKNIDEENEREQKSRRGKVPFFFSSRCGLKWNPFPFLARHPLKIVLRGTFPFNFFFCLPSYPSICNKVGCCCCCCCFSFCYVPGDASHKTNNFQLKIPHLKCHPHETDAIQYFRDAGSKNWWPEEANRMKRSIKYFC